MTAKAQSQDTVEALQNGANDFISKPVDMAVTQAWVRTPTPTKKPPSISFPADQRQCLGVAVDGGDLAEPDLDLGSGRSILPRWGSFSGTRLES